MGPVAPAATSETGGSNEAIIVVVGPTASGKSKLARAIAERAHGVVINADSMQVYRELRILTARPDDEDLARAPHRLYGVLAASERCSAGRWRAMAVAEIARARKGGRIPVIAGGTGLYIKALINGLAPIPPIPEAVQAAAAERVSRHGGEALHAELAVRDPAAAARIPPSDRQRLARAWAVLEATGRPLSEWQKETPSGIAARVFILHLDPPRAALYAACDARFEHMLARGALDEVRALAALDLDPRLPVMKALGVAPLAAHLRGEFTLEAAAARARQVTRNYAKRQRTWFRHQITPAKVINAQFSERLFDEIFTDIRQFLLTPSC